MTDSITKITALLEMMKAHDVVELELSEGDFSVALRKHGAFAPAAPMAPAAAVAPAAQAVMPVAAPAADADAGLIPIKSPIVGTFYRAPSPEAEAFVQAGSAVNRGSVVCIIEAMKIMNEVRAEMEGKIERVLVESGEPVEYGQPLFLVRRG